ncbi:MAG: TY-Chap2 family putative peptide chaperone [Actinomycetota bacterium]
MRRTIPASYAPRHPSRQVLEIASWRVAAEMVRRYPRIRIIQTHPGGGQVDSLSLLLTLGAEPRERLDLNRLGGVQYHFRRPNGSQTFKAWPDFWAEFINASDPREPMRKLASFAGLPPVAKLRPATPAVVVYRFVAAFLTHAAFATSFGKSLWGCENGYLDTSDGYGGVWESRFELFPGALDRLKAHEDHDPFGVSAYRFWFLLLNDDPLLCVETSGSAWDRTGLEYDFSKYIREDDRIWPVVSEVAGDLLS